MASSSTPAGSGSLSVLAGDAEQEKLFTVLTNYLSLGQFELARTVLDDLFQDNPDRVVNTLRAIIFRHVPSNWLLTDSVPSPAHLAWLAFVEYREYYARVFASKHLSSLSTTHGPSPIAGGTLEKVRARCSLINPVGFITHDEVAVTVVAGKDFVTRSNSNLFYVSAMVGQMKAPHHTLLAHPASATDATYTFNDSFTARIRYSDAVLRIRVVGVNEAQVEDARARRAAALGGSGGVPSAMRSADDESALIRSGDVNEESVGECILPLHQVREKGKYRVWIPLEAPSENAAAQAAGGGDRRSGSFGKIRLTLRWTKSGEVRQGQVSRRTRALLETDLLLAAAATNQRVAPGTHFTTLTPAVVEQVRAFVRGKRRSGLVRASHGDNTTPDDIKAAEESPDGMGADERRAQAHVDFQEEKDDDFDGDGHARAPDLSEQVFKELRALIRELPSIGHGLAGHLANAHHLRRSLFEHLYGQVTGEMLLRKEFSLACSAVHHLCHSVFEQGAPDGVMKAHRDAWTQDRDQADQEDAAKSADYFQDRLTTPTAHAGSSPYSARLLDDVFRGFIAYVHSTNKPGVKERLFALLSGDFQLANVSDEFYKATDVNAAVAQLGHGADGSSATAAASSAAGDEMTSLSAAQTVSKYKRKLNMRGRIYSQLFGTPDEFALRRFCTLEDTYLFGQPEVDDNGGKPLLDASGKPISKADLALRRRLANIPQCFDAYHDALRALDTVERTERRQLLARRAQDRLREQREFAAGHVTARERSANRAREAQEDARRKAKYLSERDALRARFWCDYYAFVRVTQQHIFQYPLKMALLLIRRRRWAQADRVLRPFNQLRPLVVLLAWDELDGQYLLRSQLIVRLWRNVMNDPSREFERQHDVCAEPRLVQWCHRLDFYVRLINICLTLEHDLTPADFGLGGESDEKVEADGERRRSAKARVDAFGCEVHEAEGEELTVASAIANLFDTGAPTPDERHAAVSSEAEEAAQRRRKTIMVKGAALLSALRSHSILFALKHYLPSLPPAVLLDALEQQPDQGVQDGDALHHDIHVLRTYYAVRCVLALVSNASTEPAKRKGLSVASDAINEGDSTVVADAGFRNTPLESDEQELLRLAGSFIVGMTSAEFQVMALEKILTIVFMRRSDLRRSRGEWVSGEGEANVDPQRKRVLELFGRIHRSLHDEALDLKLQRRFNEERDRRLAEEEKRRADDDNFLSNIGLSEFAATPAKPGQPSKSRAQLRTERKERLAAAAKKREAEREAVMDALSWDYMEIDTSSSEEDWMLEMDEAAVRNARAMAALSPLEQRRQMLMQLAAAQSSARGDQSAAGTTTHGADGTITRGGVSMLTPTTALSYAELQKKVGTTKHFPDGSSTKVIRGKSGGIVVVHIAADGNLSYTPVHPTTKDAREAQRLEKLAQLSQSEQKLQQQEQREGGTAAADAGATSTALQLPSAADLKERQKLRQMRREARQLRSEFAVSAVHIERLLLFVQRSLKRVITDTFPKMAAPLTDAERVRSDAQVVPWIGIPREERERLEKRQQKLAELARQRAQRKALEKEEAKRAGKGSSSLLSGFAAGESRGAAEFEDGYADEPSSASDSDRDAAFAVDEERELLLTDPSQDYLLSADRLAHQRRPGERKADADDTVSRVEAREREAEERRQRRRERRRRYLTAEERRKADLAEQARAPIEDPARNAGESDEAYAKRCRRHRRRVRHERRRALREAETELTFERAWSNVFGSSKEGAARGFGGPDGSDDSFDSEFSDSCSSDERESEEARKRRELANESEAARRKRRLAERKQVIATPASALGRMAALQLHVEEGLWRLRIIRQMGKRVTLPLMVTPIENLSTWFLKRDRVEQARLLSNKHLFHSQYPALPSRHPLSTTLKMTYEHDVPKLVHEDQCWDELCNLVRRTCHAEYREGLVAARAPVAGEQQRVHAYPDAPVDASSASTSTSATASAAARKSKVVPLVTEFIAEFQRAQSELDVMVGGGRGNRQRARDQGAADGEHPLDDVQVVDTPDCRSEMQVFFLYMDIAIAFSHMLQHATFQVLLDRATAQLLTAKKHADDDEREGVGSELPDDTVDYYLALIKRMRAQQDATWELLQRDIPVAGRGAHKFRPRPFGQLADLSRVKRWVRACRGGGVANADAPLDEKAAKAAAAMHSYLRSYEEYITSVTTRGVDLTFSPWSGVRGVHAIAFLVQQAEQARRRAATLRGELEEQRAKLIAAQSKDARAGGAERADADAVPVFRPLTGTSGDSETLASQQRALEEAERKLRDGDGDGDGGDGGKKANPAAVPGSRSGTTDALDVQQRATEATLAGTTRLNVDSDRPHTSATHARDIGVDARELFFRSGRNEMSLLAAQLLPALAAVRYVLRDCDLTQWHAVKRLALQHSNFLPSFGRWVRWRLHNYYRAYQLYDTLVERPHLNRQKGDALLKEMKHAFGQENMQLDAAANVKLVKSYVAFFQKLDREFAKSLSAPPHQKRRWEEERRRREQAGQILDDYWRGKHDGELTDLEDLYALRFDLFQLKLRALRIADSTLNAPQDPVAATAVQDLLHLVIPDIRNDHAFRQRCILRLTDFKKAALYTLEYLHEWSSIDMCITLLRRCWSGLAEEEQLNVDSDYLERQRHHDPAHVSAVTRKRKRLRKRRANLGGLDELDHLHHSDSDDDSDLGLDVGGGGGRHHGALSLRGKVEFLYYFILIYRQAVAAAHARRRRSGAVLNTARDDDRVDRPAGDASDDDNDHDRDDADDFKSHASGMGGATGSGRGLHSTKRQAAFAEVVTMLRSCGWQDFRRKCNARLSDVIGALLQLKEAALANKLFRLYLTYGGLQPGGAIDELIRHQLEAAYLSSLFARGSATRDRIFVMKRLRKVEAASKFAICRSMIQQLDCPHGRHVIINYLVRFLRQAEHEAGAAGQQQPTTDGATTGTTGTDGGQGVAVDVDGIPDMPRFNSLPPADDQWLRAVQCADSMLRRVPSALRVRYDLNGMFDNPKAIIEALLRRGHVALVSELFDTFRAYRVRRFNPFDYVLAFAKHILTLQHEDLGLGKDVGFACFELCTRNGQMQRVAVVILEIVDKLSSLLCSYEHTLMLVHLMKNLLSFFKHHLAGRVLESAEVKFRDYYKLVFGLPADTDASKLFPRHLSKAAVDALSMTAAASSSSSGGDKNPGVVDVNDPAQPGAANDAGGAAAAGGDGGDQEPGQGGPELPLKGGKEGDGGPPGGADPAPAAADGGPNPEAKDPPPAAAEPAGQTGTGATTSNAKAEGGSTKQQQPPAQAQSDPKQQQQQQQQQQQKKKKKKKNVAVADATEQKANAKVPILTEQQRRELREELQRRVNKDYLLTSSAPSLLYALRRVTFCISDLLDTKRAALLRERLLMSDQLALARRVWVECELRDAAAFDEYIGELHREMKIEIDRVDNAL